VAHEQQEPALSGAATKYRRMAVTVLTLVMCLGLWQLVSQHSSAATFISSPAQAALALAQMWTSGQLIADVAASAMRAVGGFFLGSAVGVASGLATGRSWVMSASLGEILRLGRGIPAISIIPFIILWLGLGELSKTITVAWAVYFAVWINVHMGIQSVPRKYLWSAQSLGASRWQLLVQIVLPAALPPILNGMRTGIGLAYISLFGAEMAGAFAGVGYRIYAAYTVYRVDQMVADLVVLGLMAAVTDLIFSIVSRGLFPWIALQSGSRSTPAAPQAAR